MVSHFKLFTRLHLQLCCKLYPLQHIPSYQKVVMSQLAVISPSNDKLHAVLQKAMHSQSHTSFSKLAAVRAVFSSLELQMLSLKTRLHLFLQYPSLKFKTDLQSCTACFILLKFLHLKIYSECLYTNLMQKARSLQKSILRLNLSNLILRTRNHFLLYPKLKLTFCMFCKNCHSITVGFKKHQHGGKNREISVIHAEFVENTVV